MSQLKKVVSILIILILACSISTTVFAGYKYIHDPMDNPEAAADIVADPNAVYGYRLNPESVSLKELVDYDWSDPDVVEKVREERIAYHESLKEIYDMVDSMKAKGKTTEEIARAASTRRNEIRFESFKDDPEGLEMLKNSNLEKYGNENGGTPEYYYEKYGSWQTVLEKSLSTNPGMDACVGLYDEYYHDYIIRTYIVKKGDCLSMIAKKMLDDETLWPQIYRLNSDQIKDPNLIYLGQELILQNDAE